MSWTNQTFKQLAERAAWRAHLKPKKKKKKSKSPSSQAGGPAPDESGHKLKVLTTEEYKILWDQYSVKKRSK